MSDSPAAVDAVLLPSHATASFGANDADKIQWIAAQFGPVLGEKRVSARSVADGTTLVTREQIGVTRFFAKDHPNAGAERYEWTDRGDGVKYGVLVEDARA